jgi:hypothetical protein
MQILEKPADLSGKPLKSGKDDDLITGLLAY